MDRRRRYVRGVTLDELRHAIQLSWCSLTAERPERWTPENPAYLQCSATARVVRDFFGGEILVAPVLRSGEPSGFHAWNRLADGVEVDLTREQFQADEEIGDPTVREPWRAFLAAALLRARVERHLAEASLTGEGESRAENPADSPIRPAAIFPR
jgi:hypothetical protein